MLGQVVGTVVRLPVSLVHGIEQVLHDLASIAERAGRVLDAIEGMPARVDAVLAAAEPAAARVRSVLDAAEPLAGRVGKVVGRTERLAGRADNVVVDAAGVIAEAALALAAVRPAVEALGRLDPKLITTLIEDSAQGVPRLLAAVEERLLPALAQLEQLVPVIEHLEVQVDHLDATVADVGAMLGGIPGAARLLKRGATAART